MVIFFIGTDTNVKKMNLKVLFTILKDKGYYWYAGQNLSNIEEFNKTISSSNYVLIHENGSITRSICCTGKYFDMTKESHINFLNFIKQNIQKQNI